MHLLFAVYISNKNFTSFYASMHNTRRTHTSTHRHTQAHTQAHIGLPAQTDRSRRKQISRPQYLEMTDLELNALY